MSINYGLFMLKFLDRKNINQSFMYFPVNTCNSAYFMQLEPGIAIFFGLLRNLSSPPTEIQTLRELLDANCNKTKVLQSSLCIFSFNLLRCTQNTWQFSQPEYLTGRQRKEIIFMGFCSNTINQKAVQQAHMRSAQHFNNGIIMYCVYKSTTDCQCGFWAWAERYLHEWQYVDGA